jgi:hypothetical protein
MLVWTEKAARMAKQGNQPLVLCNGLTSVVEAQHYGVPAFCWTDGETGGIPSYLIPELVKYLKDGLSLILALDADTVGREAARKTREALTEYDEQISQVDFGGDEGYDLRDYVRTHKDTAMDCLHGLARNFELMRPTVSVDSRRAHDQYIALTSGMMRITGEILPMPFASWREHGGFLAAIPPRKVIGILGYSGGGKTSLVESMIEEWTKMGFDILMYGAEWAPVEYHARRIQRHGGMTAQQWLMHLMALNEQQNNVDPALRSGVLQGDKLTKKSYAISQKLVSSPGSITYIDHDGLLGDVLEHMSKQLFDLRRAGRRPAAAVFDYIQLVEVTRENGQHPVSLATAQIKRWCGQENIVGIITSQVTKQDSRMARNSATPSVLGSTAGQWFREDRCNLFLTTNHLEDEEFVNGIGTGRRINTGLSVVNVTKNSIGPRPRLRMRFDGRRLLWIDQQWGQDEIARLNRTPDLSLYA